MFFRLAVFIAVLACFVEMANAVPRTPTDDAEVLQALPVKRGDPAAREMASLRGLLAREPRHLEAATRLASLQLAQARRESDARFLGQAQATLAPWWSEAEPPSSVLLLRATLRQSSHDFGPALADLSQAVRRNPNAAQAWLTLATVQQVTGDLAAARESCRRLAGLASPFVAVTCLAAVDGASGDVAAAYRALDAVMPAAAGQPVVVQAWALTLRGELAGRLGRPADAEAAYRQAIALDPRDTYARAAYADFLIDQRRPTDALQQLGSDQSCRGARCGPTPTGMPDALLLRYVIAARDSGAPDAEAMAEVLGARLAAARARGDRIHRREEARYLLHVRHEASAALPVAIENWAVQKESADARLVHEAAMALAPWRLASPGA